MCTGFYQSIHAESFSDNMKPGEFRAASSVKGDCRAACEAGPFSSLLRISFREKVAFAVAVADGDRMKLSVVEETLRVVFLWYFGL